MATKPVLLVVSGPDAGRAVPLAGRLTIGREGTDIVLSDPRVSRLHAIIELIADAVEIADAGSSGGTRMNGAAVTTPVPVVLGASIIVGQTELTVVQPVRVAAGGGSLLEVREGGTVSVAVPPVGIMVLGRAATADITVANGGLSRMHLEFTRSGDEVLVRDLGSSNGTLLNGRRLDSIARTLRPGDELEFPTTRITASLTHPGRARSSREFRLRDLGGIDRAVRLTARPDATIGQVAAAAANYLGLPERRWALTHDSHLLHSDDLWDCAGIARGERILLVDAVEAGDLVATVAAGRTVDRRPTAAYRPEPHRIDVPRAPSAAPMRGRGYGWQLGAGALGLVTGIVIGAVTGNWLFAVLGGVAGVGASVFGLLAERSRRIGEMRRFRERVEQLDADARDAVAARSAVARTRSPHPDGWSQVAASPGPPLWERRPEDADFGRLTLGTGSRALAVEIVGAWNAGEDAEADGLVSALTASRALEDVPVLATASGVLAIVGPRRAVSELVTAMVVEAGLLHAPSDLAIAVVADTDDGADARWLPHVDEAGVPLVSYDQASAQTLIDRLSEKQNTRHTVAVLAPGLSVDARGLISGWEDANGLLIVCVDDGARVPATADRVVEVGPVTAVLTGEHDDTDSFASSAAFAPSVLAAELAKQIILTLADRRDPAHSGGRGVSGEALLELLDVDLDEPDALQESWDKGELGSLSAVIGRDPEGDPVDVDFLGDGPHAMIAGTTGSGKSEVLATLLTSLITRYSPEIVSLFLVDFKGGATMMLFADAPHVVGIVTDIETDQRLAQRAFTALDAEIARRKRVLGAARKGSIGAYRAAGSPGGVMPSLIVVIDEFALLVNTQPEAKERLDIVASQGRSLGIHLVLATQNPSGVVSPTLRANTNLWLALRVVNDTESREIIGMPDAARLPLDAPGRGFMRRGGEESLREVNVARVTVPVDRAESTRLEPFADQRPAVERSDPALTQSELDAVVHAASEAGTSGRYRCPAALWHPPLPHLIRAADVPDVVPDTGLSVLLGVADDPSKQSQLPYRVDLEKGNLLITGGPGTGRSSTLRQAAISLMSAYPPSQLHLYALTVTSSLDDLSGGGRFGGVVKTDDREMLMRLVGRLAEEMKTRQLGSLVGAPRIVLLVDDYVLAKERLDSDPQVLLGDALTNLILGGRAVGIYVVLSTYSPTDLRVNTLGVFAHRVVLATHDRGDYLAIDWRPVSEVMPPSVPGRAMIHGPRELQLILPEKIREVRAAEGAPTPLRRLPLEITRNELARFRTSREDVLGVGGSDVEPVLLRVEPGAHVQVLGAGGTGRSSALVTIAFAALDRPGARVAIITPRRGPLDALGGHEGVIGFAASADEADAVLTDAETGGASLIVVDDAELLVPPAADHLERLLREAGERGLRLAVAARPSDWGRIYDPWTRQIVASRLALLLSDFREQLARLDLRLPPAVSPGAPGRGYLVDGGIITEVQVALSESGR